MLLVAVGFRTACEPEIDRILALRNDRHRLADALDEIIHEGRRPDSLRHLVRAFFILLDKPKEELRSFLVFDRLWDYVCRCKIRSYMAIGSGRD